MTDLLKQLKTARSGWQNALDPAMVRDFRETLLRRSQLEKENNELCYPLTALWSVNFNMDKLDLLIKEAFDYTKKDHPFCFKNSITGVVEVAILNRDFRWFVDQIISSYTPSMEMEVEPDIQVGVKKFMLLDPIPKGPIKKAPSPKMVIDLTPVPAIQKEVKGLKNSDEWGWVFKLFMDEVTKKGDADARLERYQLYSYFCVWLVMAMKKQQVPSNSYISPDSFFEKFEQHYPKLKHKSETGVVRTQYRGLILSINRLPELPYTRPPG